MQTGKCHFNKKDVGATDKGFVVLEEFNEDELLKAVATVGPIAVAIQVTKNLESYAKGVFYDPTCSSYNTNALDHAVLVVGYGTTKAGEDYWLVKNSWGPKWGLDGYIMMARNRFNNCGIASLASYPIV
ncbi:hypothetical protein Avbf_10574 [Armadillidium vulgare]|nr:hypothetical protein Avbf_10574 [Armadillidium vulgare]